MTTSPRRIHQERARFRLTLRSALAATRPLEPGERVVLEEPIAATIARWPRRRGRLRVTDRRVTVLWTRDFRRGEVVEVPRSVVVSVREPDGVERFVRLRLDVLGSAADAFEFRADPVAYRPSRGIGVLGDPRRDELLNDLLRERLRLALATPPDPRAVAMVEGQPAGRRAAG